MKKMILIDIDEAGNVRLDFAGFIGEECSKEEQRLRRELVCLGLQARIETALPKRSELASDYRQRTII
jgi:hypothetical protein